MDSASRSLQAAVGAVVQVERDDRTAARSFDRRFPFDADGRPVGRDQRAGLAQQAHRVVADRCRGVGARMATGGEEVGARGDARVLAQDFFDVFFTAIATGRVEIEWKKTKHGGTLLPGTT